MYSDADRDMIICTQKRKLPASISMLLHGLVIVTEIKIPDQKKKQRHSIISSYWKVHYLTEIAFFKKYSIISVGQERQGYAMGESG